MNTRITTIAALAQAAAAELRRRGRAPARAPHPIADAVRWVDLESLAPLGPRLATPTPKDNTP